MIYITVYIITCNCIYKVKYKKRNLITKYNYIKYFTTFTFD